MAPAPTRTRSPNRTRPRRGERPGSMMYFFVVFVNFVVPRVANGRFFCSDPERLVQEGNHLRPDLRGERGVQRPERVVRSHEGVAGAGMDGERDVLAHSSQFGFERA